MTNTAETAQTRFPGREVGAPVSVRVEVGENVVILDVATGPVIVRPDFAGKSRMRKIYPG